MLVAKDDGSGAGVGYCDLVEQKGTHSPRIHVSVDVQYSVQLLMVKIACRWELGTGRVRVWDVGDVVNSKRTLTTGHDMRRINRHLVQSKGHRRIVQSRWEDAC